MPKHCEPLYFDALKYYDKLLINSNPYNILKRGFSVTIDQNGKLVKKIKDINLNDKIDVKFYDGTASSIVRSINYDNEKEKK